MPDYIFMLESRLSPEQLRLLNWVQQEAQDIALNIYLVGGAVRDLMAGSPIRDLDFAVEGNPLRLARRFDGEGVRRRETNEPRRSVELVLTDGVSLSLEMARSEFYQQPGHPPEIKPAAILEDLQRRDFSANAMGISLTPGSRGLLLDPTNGLVDIENRELRVLHNYSFLHDPIRLLRLVRFATRLGFRPEARTKELFQMALKRGYQGYIQTASLGREVEQIAREENVVAVLKALAEHELLVVLHPLLQKRKPDYGGLAKLQKYSQHALEAGYRLDPFYVVLYYLLRRLKGGAQKRILRRLGLNKAQAKEALGLERRARQVVKLLGRERRAGPRQIYHLLSPIPVELLLFVLAEYSDKKKVQAKVYNYLFRYRPLHKKLPVRELQLMGVPPGPRFDQILEKFFEAQLDGKLRGRPQQLRFLRQLAGLPKAARQPKRPKKRKEPPAPTERSETRAKTAEPAAQPAPQDRRAAENPLAQERPGKKEPGAGKKNKKKKPVQSKRKTRARQRLR